MLPGSYVLLWYANDDVWHERAVLWKVGEEWEVITPDDDKYLERITTGDEGPVKIIILPSSGVVPSSVTEDVYRFSSYPSEAEHNSRLRKSFELAKSTDGDKLQLFSQVIGYDCEELASDKVVGRSGIPRRLTGKTGTAAPPAGAAPSLPRLPVAPSRRLPLTGRPAGESEVRNPWDDVVARVNVVPDGYMSVAAETVDSDLMPVGMEVMLDARRDFLIGRDMAMHSLGGDWLKCKLIKQADAFDFAAEVAGRYGVKAGGGGGPRGSHEPTFTPAASEAGEGEAAEDVRTLAVDTDDQGERFKEWRVVLRESKGFAWSQVPVGLGVWTLLDTMKAMGRNNGDAQVWLSAWARLKKIEETDRVMHELRTLVNVLYYGATYDQLNCPALLSFELLNRRICALIDAHRVPTKPDWSSAKYYDISKSAEDVIPDSLRLHAGRKEKEHNELMNGRRRGAAAESV